MMLAFAIDPWAQLWLKGIERACWQGGLALLIAWIICRLWRSMPGRAHCWVWRLAYAKLLLTLVWSAPVNLHLLPAHQQQPVALKHAAVDHSSISFSVPLVLPLAPLRIPPPAERPVDWPIILLASWALGVGIVLALTLGRLVSTIRMRRECEPIDDPDVLSACEKIAAKLGLETIPPILQSRRATSPMLVGPFCSAIVLPAAALEQRRSRLELMLAHELAHYRRHDLLWNWLSALADLMMFFHPLVWVARRESCLAQELASDQLVLEMSRSAPSEYAQTLLSIALRKKSARPPAFAVGALTTRKSLHRRIVAMSRFSNWSSVRWTIAGAIVIALALLIIPPWRVVAADKQGSPGPATNPSQAHSAAENPGDGQMHPNRPRTMGSPMGMGGPSRFSGQIVAATIKLRPPAAGMLQKVNVQDGQRVKQGEILFQIDSRREQADLRVSEAQIQLAETELRRAQALASQKTISKEDLETKMANVAIAQANVELKKLAIEQLTIRAPFDGVVHTGFIAGEQVSPSDFLGDLIQIDSLGASFRAPETMVGQVKVGQEIEIQAPSDAHPIKAKISSVAPIVDQLTGTFEVQALLVAKTNRLMPGMLVKVSIEPASGGDEKPDALKR